MNAGLTVGTAGHVDHGKTVLVKALTGRGTDRLKEELHRGLSIELGYAELDLGDTRLSLIDVPGHERFVRTMIAGATGIDLFLMVVAADDGVMPQTREHATVLAALGIKHGVVAITKIDRADASAQRSASMEARELFPDLPIVPVSARTGEGLVDLRSALAGISGAIVSKRDGGDHAGRVRLHIDRVFTVVGHGTVVTGTLWSGTVHKGDLVEIFPRGLRARVRQIQVHDRSFESAGPRQRVALNLAGLDREQISRGDVVADLGAAFHACFHLELAVSILERPLENRERIQIHHGTRASTGTAFRQQGNRLRVQLEKPLVTVPGDRVVLRQIAPPSTLGGGIVLAAEPHARSSSANAGPAATPVCRPVTPPSGPPRRATPEMGNQILAELRKDGSTPRGGQDLAAALELPYEETIDVLNWLARDGALIRAAKDVWYPPEQLALLQSRVIEAASIEGAITVARVRDLLSISRKYALALLGHLDAERITIRQGDVRVLRSHDRLENR